MPIGAPGVSRRWAPDQPIGIVGAGFVVHREPDRGRAGWLRRGPGSTCARPARSHPSVAARCGTCDIAVACRQGHVRGILAQRPLARNRFPRRAAPGTAVRRHRHARHPALASFLGGEQRLTLTDTLIRHLDLLLPEHGHGQLVREHLTRPRHQSPWPTSRQFWTTSIRQALAPGRTRHAGPDHGLAVARSPLLGGHHHLAIMALRRPIDRIEHALQGISSRYERSQRQPV